MEICRAMIPISGAAGSLPTSGGIAIIADDHDFGDRPTMTDVLNLPRPAWMTEDVVAARRSGAALHRRRIRSASGEMARGPFLSARGVDQSRRSRPALRLDAGGIWRRRRHVCARGGDRPRNMRSPASIRSARRCIPASSRRIFSITAPRSRSGAGCRSSPPANWSAPSP